MIGDATSVIALDVGNKRIGVAIASDVARIASPLTTITNDTTTTSQISNLVAQHNVGVAVVGLPRNLEGQETLQTKKTREFATKLKNELPIKVVLQDEAVTSKQAEAELKAKKRTYDKGDIDMLAATYILEDYLSERDN